MEYTHQNYNNEDIDIQNMDDSYKVFFSLIESGRIDVFFPLLKFCPIKFSLKGFIDAIFYYVKLFVLFYSLFGTFAHQFLVKKGF